MLALVWSLVSSALPHFRAEKLGMESFFFKKKYSAVIISVSVPFVTSPFAFRFTVFVRN